ncbi:MAG: hypothetical protein J4G13_12135 [Dehalococcoidia bacterium]|nr:hypothetical protein [Dehalococcoidia bacterium]
MTTVVDYHSERSWHFLDLVDDEVERGELEEASNKLWGAAAHAIKAVAERRGWQHGAHRDLEETVLRLVDDEGAPPALYTYYALASWFHSRFYGGPPNANQIRHGKGEMASFIRLLENL